MRQNELICAQRGAHARRCQPTNNRRYAPNPGCLLGGCLLSVTATAWAWRLPPTCSELRYVHEAIAAEEGAASTDRDPLTAAAGRAGPGRRPRVASVVAVATIDPTGPVPPYRQIAAIIRARIESGEYPKGSRIPTESEIVETFEVARTTARRSIALLREQGLIETVPQRGSYVRLPADGIPWSPLRARTTRSRAVAAPAAAGNSPTITHRTTELGRGRCADGRGSRSRRPRRRAGPGRMRGP